MSDKSAVVPATANGEIQVMRPADKFRQFMLARAQMNRGERTTDLIDNQIERVIDARSEQEIWDALASGVVQARDAGGVEMEVHSFEVAESLRQDIESEYYISVQATCLGGPEEVLLKNGLKIGADFVLQTGAELIIAPLRAFEAQDLLPVRVAIVAIKTQSGNTFLKLRPLPKRAVTTN